MSGISTHVLDLTTGLPADGVEVRLDFRAADGSWRTAGRGTTDHDGRARDFLGGAPPERGTYRLGFQTGAWFERRGVTAFHPWVEIVFLVDQPDRSHHVPLLLGPFGYTTYRGS